MPKIALVANYAAGKNQLGLLAQSLAGEVGTLTSLTINEDVTPKEIGEVLHDADCLVVGSAPSAEAARPEIEAIKQAHTLDIPIYLYSDTFGSALRPWLADVRQYVTDVFVVSETERASVGAVFAHSRIHIVGNPEWWAQREPSVSYEAARAQLGVQDDEILILFGGTKQEFADVHVLGKLVNAAMLLPDSPPVCVMYTMHPGTALFGEGKKDELAVRQFMERMLNVPVNSIPRVRVAVAEKGQSTELVQCGADLVAETLSFTGMLASIRQQPLVSFMTPMFLAHKVHLQGSDKYPLTDSGASIKAPTHEVELSFLLRDLLSGEPNRQKQLAAQAEFISVEYDPCELMKEALLS